MLLRTRIFLGVMAGLAFVIIGLMAGRLHSDSQNESRYQALAIHDQTVLWRKIVEGQIQAIEAGVSGLTRNRQAMQALAENDRDSLGDAVIGVFNRMSTRNVISRLHIADLSGRLVYSSIGQIEQTSLMAEMALDRGELVAGLYQDIDNSLQVAVATPLFHRGKPAGVGLLMRDVGAALADLRDSIGAETAILEPEGQWLAATDPPFFAEGLSSAPARVQQSPEQQTRIAVGDLAFTATPTAVSDYAGRGLGLLVSVRDETELVVDGQRRDLVSYGLTALLLVLVIGFLYVYINRSFKTLQEISQLLGPLSEGKSVKLPGHGRKDELGQLVRATDRIYQKSFEAARLQTALDRCDVMVMIANRRGNIVYQNHALSDYFQQHQSEIAKTIPGFDGLRLIGSSIDGFHQDAEGVRELLEKLTDRHRIIIRLGSRHVRLAVTPIRGADGAFLGTVVEWADATTEVNIQSQIDRVVAAAGKGNFDERVSIQDAGTYANIVAGINRLNEQMASALDDVANVLRALAKGRLNQRMADGYEGKFAELSDHAGETAERLALIVSDIQGSAKEVANAASEIGSGTDDLAGRTERAAANLEETAAAAEELAATVKNNAVNAGKASELSTKADVIAGQGGEVVKSAVSAMAEIDQSAEKITAIISVIDEIAFQTNLLALNASVEAARAGEAGKGFAVVAQEVRQLAQRSARAAADIKELIQDSNHQVKNGVSLVNQAGEALNEIVASIGDVSRIVSEISAASQDQSLGVQNINRSIASMDEMTQQNSALVEESSGSARSLNDQAIKLTDAVAFFQIAADDETNTIGARVRTDHDRTAHAKPLAKADCTEF